MYKYANIPLFHSEKIRLVDQQQALSLSLSRYSSIHVLTSYFMDVIFKIDTSESEWVSRIDNLNNKM
jgi:hypothetical protein